MKVLLIGSGGREHALAWLLAQSEHCTALYAAPGNPGIAECAECVDIAVDDVGGLVDFAKKNAIDLVVVGPEIPLVSGVVDMMEAEGIAAFGPSRAAAQLEGSKAFMKDFAARHNIPTAAYGRFTDIQKAEKFIRDTGAPIVVKASGLAAGKGVIIAQTVNDAVDAARDMLSGEAFGESGREIVIEEFLDGEELSFFAIADGHDFVPLTSAQDHKRVGDGDTGPNTGGMGAYSPARLMDWNLGQTILEDIIRPTIAGMKEEGYPFKGILFAGIMVVDGRPVLLEFNTRFGDPECQTIMMRLGSDLLELLHAAATGDIARVEKNIEWFDDVSLCVVMAAKGYPDSHVKNTVINDMSRVSHLEGVKVFHAGTGRDAQGNLIATGGRVLGVTAVGKTVEEARARAYQAVDLIDWPEGFCRKDIAWRAL